MRNLALPSILIVTLALAAPGLHAQSGATAHATLQSPDGESVGTAHLTETATGGVLVQLRLHGLPPGAHAFHIHETGACAPDFTAAGGHYAPHGDSHGLMHGEDDHAGDLLNIHVPDDAGEVLFERVATEVTLEPGASGSLFDSDGSAIIIHEGPDDYASQPSGAAGARIACGVIER